MRRYAQILPVGLAVVTFCATKAGHPGEGGAAPKNAALPAMHGGTSESASTVVATAVNRVRRAPPLGRVSRQLGRYAAVLGRRVTTSVHRDASSVTHAGSLPIEGA